MNDYFYHWNQWVVHLKRFLDLGDLFECQKHESFGLFYGHDLFKHTIWTKIDFLSELANVWKFKIGKCLYWHKCLWGLNRQMSGLAFVYLNWRMSSCSMSIGECLVGECLIGVYGYTHQDPHQGQNIENIHKRADQRDKL